MSEWKPIQSAPRDGTIVILGGGIWGDDELDAAPRVMAARWYEGNNNMWFWNTASAEAGYSVFPYDDPTHWQPLPAPPPTPEALPADQEQSR